MVKFNHNGNTFYESLNISQERYDEIVAIVDNYLSTPSKYKIKSEELEKLIELIDPQNDNELIMIGIQYGVLIVATKQIELSLEKKGIIDSPFLKPKKYES